VSSSDDELRELRRLAPIIERIERELDALRTQRDRRIASAIRAGASERSAASAAGVSPVWAHKQRKRHPKMQRS
jgi:hypothetical protein